MKIKEHKRESRKRIKYDDMKDKSVTNWSSRNTKYMNTQQAIIFTARDKFILHIFIEIEV